MEQSTAFHKVDIYLYEHMLVEAIAQLDRLDYEFNLERVIQATHAELPDWGIEVQTAGGKYHGRGQGKPL